MFINPFDPAHHVTGIDVTRCKTRSTCCNHGSQSLMYHFADDMHTCITYKCFKKTKPSFAIFNGDIYTLDAICLSSQE